MSLTLLEAMKAAENPFQAEMFKAIATQDRMFPIMPWKPVAGEGYPYEREVSVGSFAAIDVGGSIAESTGKSEKLTISNREFAGDFYVPNFAQAMTSSRVSQYDRQLLMKLKAAGRALAAKMITGSSISGTPTMEAFQAGAYVDTIVATSPYIREREGVGEIKYTHVGTFAQFRAPGDTAFGTAVACATDGDYTLASGDPSKWITVTLDVSDASADAIRRISFASNYEFDGLLRQVSSSQTRDADGTSGDALSFAIMEQLVDAVTETGGQLAFVMNEKLKRKYNALVRGTGGTDPGWVFDGPLGKITYPSFNGIPILTNNNVPSNETGSSGGTTLSSVFLANFEEGAGVHMAAFGGETQMVEADPRDTSVLGFQIHDLGQKTGESKRGGRLLWFGGMACGSDLSLARAKRIVTA